MKKKTEEMILITLLLFSIIPVFLIISRLNFHVDLTDNREYSIKESTENTLALYDQPLYITWWKSDEFTSSQLDIISSLFQKLPVNTEIRTPDEQEKIRLRELGFPEKQIEYSRAGVLTEALVFSGLEISYLDKRVIVPFLVDPHDLEFLILEALSRMEDGGRKSLAVFTDTDQNTILLSELSRYFDVQSVSDDNPLKSIPDILIVSSTMDYSNENLFAIDRAIQTGSPVFFFVDAMDIDPRNSDYAHPLEEPSLIQNWLESYGISVGDALISDRESLLLDYASGDSQRVSNYHFWLKGNDQLDVLWGFPISIADNEGFKSKVLIQSSEMSWLNEGDVDLRPFYTDHEPVYTGPYSVAVEISGNFQPLFQYSEESEKKEGKIIVIGSTLSFSDYIQSSGSFKNTRYLRNEIYRLLGKNNLYDIALFSGQNFLMDEDSDILGSRKIVIILLNLILLPLFTVFIYLYLLFRRRRRRNV